MRRWRPDRIHGDAHVAIGAVLEADRARQAGGQFAVHLALGGAGTDGAPGDQVSDVLRRDHVEELVAADRPSSLISASSWRARRRPR